MTTKKETAIMDDGLDDLLVEDTKETSLTVYDEGALKKQSVAWCKLEKVAREYAILQDDMIRATLLAILASEHVLLVGPPGCNKTHVINVITTLIGAADKTFFATLDKFATPDALLGPVSVRALREEDRYKRNVSGMLPEAEFAFIGEVFHGNGAVRRSLHTLVNERYIENSGQRFDVPLMTMFCDSNAYPFRTEDMPFYDRLMLRVECEYLPTSDADAFVGMLCAPEFDSDVQPLMSLVDVRASINTVRNIPVPEACIRALHDVRERLIQDNVVLSNRRYRRAMSVLQAAAFLRGAGQADLVDLAALKHVLWDTPMQRANIESALAIYEGACMEQRDAELLETIERIYQHAISQNDAQAIYDALGEAGDAAASCADAAISAKINEFVSLLEQEAIKMEGKK